MTQTPTVQRTGNVAVREELPLDGVRVVDLTRAWAGPSCTAFLAELGADVIKVEEPAGEGMRMGGFREVEGAASDPSVVTDRPYNLSTIFNHLNRGKRAIAIDLSEPRGREVLLGLVAQSQIVVENYRPGVMESLGLGFEVLREANPAIILGSNGGYGHSGPYSAYRGYGVAVEPMSGLFSVTGYEGGHPLRSGVDHPDPQAGLSMASGLLVALYRQRRTGLGQHVKTSLLRAMAACFAPRVIEYRATREVPTRHGNDSEAYSPHGVYRCAGEDEWLAIAVTNVEQWRALCDGIERPEIGSDATLDGVEARRERREEIDAAIGAWTGGRTKAEAEAELQRRAVPAAAVQSVSDLLADEQFISRQFFRELPHAEAGTKPYAGPRLKLDGHDLPASGGPMFAEHRIALLRDLLGISQSEIESLDAQHIVPAEPWRPAVSDQQQGKARR